VQLLQPPASRKLPNQASISGVKDDGGLIRRMIAAGMCSVMDEVMEGNPNEAECLTEIPAHLSWTEEGRFPIK
jgi:hypothetical protein